MPIEVGQKLWFVPSHRRGAVPYGGAEVRVAKVGRVWLTVTLEDSRIEYRLDKKTLVADGAGYTSPGRAWPSRDAYEAHVERLRAWNGLASRMDRRHGPADGVTTEAIRQAAALLGIDLESDHA